MLDSKNKINKRWTSRISNPLKNSARIAKWSDISTKIIKQRKISSKKTPIKKAKALTKRLGLINSYIFLKNEGVSLTGTHKDRSAISLVLESLNEYDGIVTATCGNFGAAIAKYAYMYNIPNVHIFIPKINDISNSRLKIMNKSKATIHFVEGTYEDAVYYSSDYARINKWYNANPGMNGTTEISLNSYSKIAKEIVSQLKFELDYLVCPVSNGTTIAGIHQGFKNFLEEGKIKKLPKLIAVSTKGGNPIISSYKRKFEIIEDLDPNIIRRSSINDPLINWHSFDGQIALDAVYESNGLAIEVTDEEMMYYKQILLETENINILPASASVIGGVVALNKLHEFQIKGNIVCLLTGNNQE